MAARIKVPPIGSAQWILDERHQANNLVNQEAEDFSFSARNELEWLNEHMRDIFAKEGLNVMEVFKTPGKLRGKTPRTTRKINAERKPLTPIHATNTHNSPAHRSLQKSLQKSAAKSKLHIAQDAENVLRSPAVPKALFKKPQPAKGKAKAQSKQTAKQTATSEERPTTASSAVSTDPIESFPRPAHWAYASSSQDTVPDTQLSYIFSQNQSYETQATNYSQPMQQSFEKRRDTGDSFVSAIEASNKNTSKGGSQDADQMEANEPNTEEKPLETVLVAIPQNVKQNPDEAEAEFQRDDVSESDTVVIHDIHEQEEIALVTSHEGDQDAPEEHEEAPIMSNGGGLNGLPQTTDLASPEPVQDTRGMSEQHNMPPPMAEVMDTVVHNDLHDQMDTDDVRSPSDGSSPVKPLVRKSSLTFASLPAREPLAKKSMGNRVSRTSHVEAVKGRFTGGKSLGGFQHTQATEMHQSDTTEVDNERPDLQREESETTKQHHKTTTQRLHERINMMKQQNESSLRSNHIPASLQSAQPAYPQLRPTEEEPQPKSPVAKKQDMPKTQRIYPDLDVEDDDEDWIAPVKPFTSMTSGRPPLLKAFSTEEPKNAKESEQLPARPLSFPSPMSSTKPMLAEPFQPVPRSNMGSPVRSPVRSVFASNPDQSPFVESTTPIGSPATKRDVDGALSASRSKFYSVLRAAKDKIIGTSAASAQVKLDALTQSPKPQSPIRSIFHNQSSSDDVFSPQCAEKASSSVFSHFRSPSKESNKSAKSVPGSPFRKTRSSTEREKVKERDEKEQKKNDEKLEKMREREQQKATAQFQKEKVAATSRMPAPTRRNAPASDEDQPVSADEMPPPQPKSLLPTGAGQKLRPPRRVAKAPSKELPKAKPQVIRVNLANNRFGQSTNAMAAPPQKESEVPQKSSNETLRPASAQPAATRANRALTAAANKKKEEERKALERKQRAKANEAAAAAAAKDREDKRKAEQERQNKARMERQRKEQEERKARAAAAKQAQEEQVQKAQQLAQQKAENQPRHGLSLYPLAKAPAPRPRGDLAASRPVMQMHTVGEANRSIPIPPINPAKPPKRMFQPDEDEAIPRSTLQRAGQAYQPMEGKRRRTLEEDDDEPQPARAGPSRPSVKAPPIRHSNMRKEIQNKYPTSGYVPVSQMQQSSSMLKTATAHAHFANGKIPFAESSNAGAAYKTPARPGQNMCPPAKSAAKSSPQYPNGENIALPEIMTDSEDEDSENDFNPPSWANSPALRELLTQQQMVDPEQIFGPIAPLQMEQVFPNKERHKRFRDRTSSAYWANDQLTEEDKRKDREARERLVRNGGWQYHPSPAGK
ncbi:hypothetical protein GQ43DRAFT_444920 [Delitschia confertaspora ATCC 74209]|uniref:Inner centromere protein ARK-binding domain-containing protein n=1 Tax=Delitschia confertaspora ATCC 74209 TaxID=1513339 RepID=A0A9P4JG83_9PLEO|nr:hypothetical protein GQ43DRAFT_444920 [Delitschia confertaspora ATCC 74209]